MRDNFSLKTKEILAKRVGYKCSNPDCRKSTTGPNDEGNEKYINIGVASHIFAASQNGPRYDDLMTTDERTAIENGIWLCQSCSKIIDDDTAKYTSDLLMAWKESAENLALAELVSPANAQNQSEDKEILLFFAQCFDRPAFQHPIEQEGHMDDLDRAIADTIIALNTGVLRTRDGDILRTAKGKTSISNPAWKKKLNTIVDMLVAIRQRLKIAKDDNIYWARSDGFYCFNDRGIAEWIDITRGEIIKIFSSICKEAGIAELHFPRNRYRW